MYSASGPGGGGWERLQGLVSVASDSTQHGTSGSDSTQHDSSSSGGESPSDQSSTHIGSISIAHSAVVAAQINTQPVDGAQSKRKSKYLTPEDRNNARRKRNREAQKLRRARNKEEDKVGCLLQILVTCFLSYISCSFMFH